MGIAEVWGPTIVTTVAAIIIGVFGYFYTTNQNQKEVQQREKDESLKELIEANSRVAESQVQSQNQMVKGLHELSTAVSLLKQAFEHITIDAEKKNVEIQADLNRHENEIERLRDRMHSISADITEIKIRAELKSVR